MKSLLTILLQFVLAFHLLVAQSSHLDLERKLFTLNPDLKPFYHGVASGDPLQDRVIIWTKVTPEDFTTDVDVEYFVSESEDMSTIVASGTFTTNQQRDYTVKIDVDGLSPNRYYYYYFSALGGNSVVGRTRTAPDGDMDNLRIGAVACTDYSFGYFHSYGHMAERNDIDIILHTGDYIYEGVEEEVVRDIEPPFEVYELEHYRTRYNLYRLDPDLQRAHQIYPWATIWDDHDIVVDALRDTSYRHDSIFGSYQDRKFEAIQAAREWLPMRDPLPEESFYKNWRKLSYGDLLDIFLIDVRLYDRDRFATSINDTIYGDTTHRMMGPEQLNWFLEELRNSDAKWKVVSNQLMFSQFSLGNVLPFILENWDGYPYERNKVFAAIDEDSIDNIVFLTGDWHVSYACDVTPDPFDPQKYNRFGKGSRAVEFVLPSLAANNLDEGLNVGLFQDFFEDIAQEVVETAMPHIKYADFSNHGYVLLDLNKDRAVGEFWYAKDIFVENDKGEFIRGLGRWATKDEENYIKLYQEPLEARTDTVTPPSTVPFGFVTSVENTNVELLQVYPNPVAERLFVSFQSHEAEVFELQIVNTLGQVVDGLTVNASQGLHQTTLNVQHLEKGIYFLNIQSKDKNYQLSSFVVE